MIPTNPPLVVIVIVIVALFISFMAGRLSIQRTARRTVGRNEVTEETPEQRAQWELDDKRAEIERAAFKLLEGGIWADSPSVLTSTERMAWLIDQAMNFKGIVKEKIKPDYKLKGFVGPISPGEAERLLKEREK